jgi:hypothetical protein
MRRHGRALAIILALGLAAACSRHDDSKVSADLRAAGHDAGQDVRRAAAEAGRAAHALAADTRHAAHDVAHSNPQDRRDSSS